MYNTGLTALTYSDHAIERALARKLPLLPCLPSNARLADRDSSGLVYKVDHAQHSFYVIVSQDNVVRTTFSKLDDAEWQRWMQARRIRREREQRGLMTVYLQHDDPIQDQLAAEYMMCRLIRNAFSGGGQERFKSRRAQRFQSPHRREVRARQMRLHRKSVKEGTAAGSQAD